MKWFEIIRQKLFSKFFYRIFAIITLIFLVSSFSISYITLNNLNRNMTKQNVEFMRFTSEQIKNNVMNLQRRYESIAADIYGNTSIHYFLGDNHGNAISYVIFEKFQTIDKIFEGIRNNNKEILDICIYKENATLLTDGVNIRDIKELMNQELIDKARNARGRSIWVAYNDERYNSSYCISLVKYPNIVKPGGILVISLREQSFYNMFRADDGSKYLLFIIDEENKVISSNLRDAVGKDAPSPIAQHLRLNVTIDQIEMDGASYYIHNQDIGNNMSIVILYNSNLIEMEKRQIIFTSILLTLIFVLLSLLILLFVARRFSSSVEKLVAKIRTIENGDMKVQPTIGGSDEFYMLDSSICNMAYRIDKLTKDILSAVKQKEETEIKYLQMQMNPHFLYNLLSSVRWLAVKNGQDKISFILEHTINFYKIALNRGNEVITIKEEISLVRSFVEIQNVCYNNQINLQVFMDPELEEFKVCKMTLQPFVENSILHGRTQNKVLNITISVEYVNRIVRLAVQDDGLGLEDEMVSYIESLNYPDAKKVNRSYGIINTFSRLNLLYRDRVKIFAHNNAGGAMIEILILDQKEDCLPAVD